MNARPHLPSCLFVALIGTISPQSTSTPAWRSLPEAEPVGERAHTGSYVVQDRAAVAWTKPRSAYDERAATGRKEAKVVVLIHDPILASEGGRRLTAFLGAKDPVEYSHILVNVIREASWGYVNYRIVDFIRVDAFPVKVDGFRYTGETFLAARKKQEWQPASSSYRKFFEDHGLLERFRREGITELWVWGSGGMHFDEFAGFIPNRYARYGPTDNPWLYRPYDIPPELARTTWVMGFNYEVGADNMVHSYVHRVESMAALAYGDGIWDTHERRDPWNVFSWLELDHPGTPSQVGNCHVPPTGQSGYDYANARAVLSQADAWMNFPDLSGVAPRLVSADEWGRNQFGYMKWILERVPKGPGATEHGVNNWWVHIANTDADLPEWKPPERGRFVLPDGFPAPAKKPVK
jgi:hypothetical protein